jgi:hypothetical protein
VTPALLGRIQPDISAGASCPTAEALLAAVPILMIAMSLETDFPPGEIG